MNQAALDFGRRLRDRGIAKVTRDDDTHRRIADIRAWAEAHAMSHGTVSINDVRRVTDLSELHPNAIGAIFKDRRFKAVGYAQAEHIAAHARIIRIYALEKK